MMRPILSSDRKNSINDSSYNSHKEGYAYNKLSDDQLAVKLNADDEFDVETPKGRTRTPPKRFQLFHNPLRLSYQRNRIKFTRPVVTLLLQRVASLSFYIIAWVTNGEVLQGITNGSLCPGKLPFDKPAFLTWFSYNYMILSGIFVVYPYIRFVQPTKTTKRRGIHHHHTNDDDQQIMTLSFYVTHIWAGRMGWKNAVFACAIISYMLLVLNFLFIVGLECVSVSLSNAIYQLQTPFTVGLSVCVLKDTFILSEALGIFLSLVGVALIVLPPLVVVTNSNTGGSQDNVTHDQCTFFQQQEWSSPTLIGILATLGSAVIGSLYLVSWRIFSETKSRRNHNTNYDSTNDDVGLINNASPPLGSRLEGFVDTHMTLATIGLCNLLLGWPFLILMDRLGLERLEMPPIMPLLAVVTNATTSSSSVVSPYDDQLLDFDYYYDWGILLNANGLVEYAFDASCAVAIYMTSPVATSVIAPLTIPLSIVMDHMFYGGEGENADNIVQSSMVESSSGNEAQWSTLTVVGVMAILVGVVLLEVKPDLNKEQLLPYSNRKYRRHIEI